MRSCLQWPSIFTGEVEIYVSTQELRQKRLGIEAQLHDLNARLYQHYRDQSWSTVHQNWREGFLRFVELGEAIPEGDLMDANKYAWLEGYPPLDVVQGSLEHHQGTRRIT